MLDIGMDLEDHPKLAALVHGPLWHPERGGTVPVAFLESGVLYCEDNLRQLAQFPSECIDLVYLDPPFFSDRNYEVIWGDEAEVRSFDDRAFRYSVRR